jgi:hypothetical protein
VIRFADSAVSEIEMYGGDSLLSPSLPRRSRVSIEGFLREPKSCWIPPSTVELPVAPSSQRLFSSQNVYVLTKGKQTHILPSPLPAEISAVPPLRMVTWGFIPSIVAPRVCVSPVAGNQPILQLIAFGEDIEVQEMSLSFLTKGKGKSRDDELLCSQADIGGTTGFLCEGGHWDHFSYSDTISRSISINSAVSFDSLDTEELVAKIQMEQGIYGWCQKGCEDWRVFWIGGGGGTETDHVTS